MTGLDCNILYFIELCLQVFLLSSVPKKIVSRLRYVNQGVENLDICCIHTSTETCLGQICLNETCFS